MLGSPKKYTSLAYALPMVVCLSGVAGASDECPEEVSSDLSLVGVAVGVESDANVGARTQTVPRIVLQNLGDIDCAGTVAFFDNDSNELGRVDFTLAPFLQGTDAITVCPVQVQVGQGDSEEELCSRFVGDDLDDGPAIEANSNGNGLGDFEGKAVICVDPRCEDQSARPEEGIIYAQSENLELELVVDEASGYSGFRRTGWNKGNVSRRGTGLSK